MKIIVSNVLKWAIQFNLHLIQITLLFTNN